MNEITGKVYSIGKTETVGTKGFRKRKLILIHGTPQYPKHNEFTATKDGCDALDRFNEGDQVTIEFVPDGRLRQSGDGCFNDNWLRSIAHAGQQQSQHRDDRQRGGGGRNDGGRQQQMEGTGSNQHRGQSTTSRRGPAYDDDRPPPPSDADVPGGGYKSGADNDPPF